MYTNYMSASQQAYQKAVEVLSACIKPRGFYASGLKGGYEATWARDSMISSLGASLASDKFKKTFHNSLELLGKHQAKNGQIPNCVGSYNLDRRSDITFNTIDSSLWYLIGHFVYAKAYNDATLNKKQADIIKNTLTWLSCQDPDEVGVLAQQPTMDWMDAFPHKYGYTINTNALFYAVLRMFGHDQEAKHLQKIINGKTGKYISLYDKKLGYYWPWGWKNHEQYREHEEWFDSLGNLLAIVSGLATPVIAKNILKFIEDKKINRPYACKTIWPPIKKGDKEWHDYFNNCDARTPFNYSNAGIWPFIGGFYVAALVKVGDMKKAQTELELLAQANLQTMHIRDLKGQYEFNEWLHGRTGKPGGEPYQGWSAGMYIYAYECVRQKKVLWF